MEKAEAESRGVYFLANDRVFEWTTAFLNSFRKHNRLARLCLIPYDDSCTRIKSLRRRYDFDIYDDQSTLSRCDEISMRFHGLTTGTYRKLAAWTGPFDEFIYIDVDTVILSSIDFVYQYLHDYAFITSNSNIDSTFRWVWRDSIYKSGCLEWEQFQYAANTGFIASKKSATTFDQVLSAVHSGLALREHMELSCWEQPFLNYLIVTSGKKFTSLLVLYRQGVRENLKLEKWAGEPVGTTRFGKYANPSRPPVFLIHWAGNWEMSDRNMPHRSLWQHYRKLRSFRHIFISMYKTLSRYLSPLSKTQGV